MIRPTALILLLVCSGAAQSTTQDDMTSFYTVLKSLTRDAVVRQMPDRLVVYANAYDFASRSQPANADVATFFSDVKRINAGSAGRWVICSDIPPKDFKSTCTYFRNIDANELANVQYLTVGQLKQIQQEINTMAEANKKQNSR
jgi:hypothetical protein